MKKPFHSICLKIFFASFILLILNVSASAQKIQERIISGKFQKTSLQEFFHTLEKDYGIHFYYRTDWVKSYVVNEEFKEMPLIQVLNSLFERQPITFSFFQNNSVVVFPKGIDGKNSIDSEIGRAHV